MGPRSDATKKQHKALEEAQKKERAAAAREQKKREQEAKARKKAEEPGIFGGTKVWFEMNTSETTSKTTW